LARRKEWMRQLREKQELLHNRRCPCGNPLHGQSTQIYCSSQCPEYKRQKNQKAHDRYVQRKADSISWRTFKEMKILLS
jgi:hypothetical protein